MNQEKENPIEDRQDPKAGVLSTAEKPAEPLEQGPPVEPAKAEPDLGADSEARTYDTVPGPSLTEIEKEIEYKGGPSADPPAKEKARTCLICGGPDHRGCGCEARQKLIEQDNNPGLANLGKELERDEMLEKVLSNDVVASTIHDQLSDITTILNMIVSQNDVLIELEKSRRDLIRDIQSGSKN